MENIKLRYKIEINNKYLSISDDKGILFEYTFYGNKKNRLRIDDKELDNDHYKKLNDKLCKVAQIFLSLNMNGNDNDECTHFVTN